MKLSLHISPCPNDTFAFDALINHRIEHDFDLSVEYHDIEELNEGVLRGEPDISKISYAVYPLVADRYRLLESGSALGRGNGQLLVRRKGETSKIRTVATPGKNTTANALLMRYFPDVKVRQMLFSEIAEAVEKGVTDAGVLIHEGRFVYERRNLELVADLGKMWEAETNLPLPLGAIIIKREIDENVIFFGDGVPVFKEKIAERLGDKAHFAPANLMHINGGGVAEAAKSEYKKGNACDYASLVPTYLRLSQAEREYNDRNRK